VLVTLNGKHMLVAWLPDL